MNAAETFTKAAAEIVTSTGCTVEAAVDYLIRKAAAERPEVLLKVIAASGIAA